MFKDLKVMTPTLAEDSVLLTLPFGGAVLQVIDYPLPPCPSPCLVLALVVVS